MFSKLKGKSKYKESKDSKDSKDLTSKFSWSISKEDLRADNEAKSDELKSLRVKNQNLQRLVLQLEDKFNRSKWRPTRYRRLKRMIKRCISEEAVTETTPDEADINEGSERKGLSEKFKESAKMIEQKQNELQKKKEELKEVNEDLNRQIKTEKNNHEFLANRINKLRQDYDSCKRYKFLQKYFVMKEIIKLFLQETKIIFDTLQE